MMEVLIILALGNSQCQAEAFWQEAAARGNSAPRFFDGMDFI
jgi:hypothetical protein